MRSCHGDSNLRRRVHRNTLTPHRAVSPSADLCAPDVGPNREAEDYRVPPCTPDPGVTTSRPGRTPSRGPDRPAAACPGPGRRPGPATPARPLLLDALRGRDRAVDGPVVPRRRARRAHRAAAPGSWGASGWSPGTGSCGARRRRCRPWSPTSPPCGPGLVVVPVNAAYTERELTHVVADVRPAARHRGRPRPGQRCRWPRGRR